MNKSEIITQAEATVISTREAYEAAVKALRDAELLPEPPPLKTWEVQVEVSGVIVPRTESGDAINGNLAQVLSSFPGILPEVFDANPNKARCLSVEQPADLCIIYARYNSAELTWADDAPVNIAWTEVK